LAPHYNSQHAVFASPSAFSLRILEWLFWLHLSDPDPPGKMAIKTGGERGRERNRDRQESLSSMSQKVM